MGRKSHAAREAVPKNGPMRRPCSCLLLALAALLAVPARADLLAGFRDPQDGRLDISDWLLNRKGVLPVPMLITEPAVGYGAGLAGLFFRESMGERAQNAPPGRQATPPDIYVLGGLATENGTRGAAAGGMVTSEDGRYRWRGGVVRTDLNLDFFGIGGRDAGIGYSLDGWASVQHGMVRLGDSDAWLVGRWNYFNLQSSFGAAEGSPGLVDVGRESRASGLGGSLEYDSRDNIFTPSRGFKGSLELTFYAPAFGSDQSFRTGRAEGFNYWPVGRSVVLGARGDLRTATDRAPLYLLPYVDLRGVPVMRLQDQNTLVAEGEVRWNLDPRWALVGFGGAGRAWGFRTDYAEGEGTVSKGVGVRYLLARRLGLYAGIDWAWSTQDHAWYFQIGSAWR